MTLRKTTDEVVNQFKLKYGDKYDYSKVEFKGFREKICIICRKHGEFWQRHIDHNNGKGCKKCAIEYTIMKRPKLNFTLDEFLKRSIKQHGELYNYDKVVYINSDTKVIITCPTHGDFLQSPRHHYRSKGCFKCGRVITGIKNSRIILKSEFLEESVNKQKLKYDYSLIPNEIKGVRTKVRIICLKHGIFKQTAISHMSGTGCNLCCYRGYERSDYVNHCNNYGYEKVSLYLIRIFNETESFYKIGITCKSVKERFRKLKTSTGYSYDIVRDKEIAPDRAWDLEHFLKVRYNKYKYSPEIRFTGDSECFDKRFLK